jgi:uncharacterized protein YodC (DUF2158 family)
MKMDMEVCRLRSGGPAMKVVSLTETTADVQWAGVDQIHTAAFPLACLVFDEPIFIRETARRDMDADADWYRAQAKDAHALGCKWQRASVSPDLDRILFEGWLERPAEEGPLRFFFEEP